MTKLYCKNKKGAIFFAQCRLRSHRDGRPHHWKLKKLMTYKSWKCRLYKLQTGGCVAPWLFLSTKYHLSHSKYWVNKNTKTIANRSRVNCTHNTLRASIDLNSYTPWPWNVGKGHRRSLETEPLDRSYTTYAESSYLTLNIIVILKCGWRSLKVIKMVPFERFGTVSYSPFTVTMAVSLTISEIFSVLEIWVWGCSRSLKMARFDRSCRTFY